MAVPVWFDENVYWSNKLTQLGDEWDAPRLKAVLEGAGYSTDAEGLYRHFLDYGNAENISPSAFFNVPEYLKAKAEQLNAQEGGQGFGGHQWDEASVLAAIEAAGLSVWDHYTQYGMYEGVNPSNQFDAWASTFGQVTNGWELDATGVNYKHPFHVQIALFELIIFYISIYYLKSFIQRSPIKAPCIRLFSGYYSGYPYQLAF